MDFEFFTEKTSNISPLATIYKDLGQIGINTVAMRDINCPEKQLVLLGYEKETRTIGIKLIDSPTKGARKIIFIHNHSVDASVTGQISAKCFLEHFKIDFSTTQKFMLNYDKQERLITFNLSRKFVID